MASPLQLITELGRAPVLPHNRAIDRLACPPVPDNCPLPPGRDADARQVACLQTCLAQRHARYFELTRPILARIMLHPAGLREDLPEFLLRHGAHAARMIENDRSRTRGALVQRQD